jgi:hypothetical protein
MGSLQEFIMPAWRKVPDGVRWAWQELENLVAAAPKCPTLKAAVVTVLALTDHHRALARKGGECAPGL